MGIPVEVHLHVRETRNVTSRGAVANATSDITETTDRVHADTDIPTRRIALLRPLVNRTETRRKKTNRLITELRSRTPAAVAGRRQRNNLQHVRRLVQASQVARRQYRFT